MSKRGLASVTKHTPKDSVVTTLGQLLEAQVALARLSAKPLPTKQAYHIAKLARLVAQEVDLFNQQRNALIKELGDERDPTAVEQAAGQIGRVMQVKTEHQAAFFTRAKELADLEVTIPWRAINLAEIENLVISAADINALGALVTDTV